MLMILTKVEIIIVTVHQDEDSMIFLFFLLKAIDVKFSSNMLDVCVFLLHRFKDY